MSEQPGIVSGSAESLSPAATAAAAAAIAARRLRAGSDGAAVPGSALPPPPSPAPVPATRARRSGETVRPPRPDLPPPDPRRFASKAPAADRLFRGISRGSGFVVLAIMTAIGLFLSIRAAQALKKAGVSFFTTSAFIPDAGKGHFGVAGMLVGTFLIAAVAIVVALPLATGMALYISEYAPRQVKQTLISVVDLMAAVPSLVYGLWGFYYLNEHAVGVSRWMQTYFGWIPIFKVDLADPHNPLTSATRYKSSSFIAGLVVALMATPLICSIMREVFSQAPPGEREGAYALGATRWGMIRTVVLPFGLGGMIGGTMLGLGRALGETVGVYLVISQVFAIQPHVLQNGGSSISATIAQKVGSASSFGLSALMAAGLTLFVVTLIVNMLASVVINRSRSGAATEA